MTQQNRITPGDHVFSSTVPSVEGEWPPPSLRERIEHLSLLRVVYDGDTDDVPAVRWVQRACVEMAEFMTVGVQDDMADLVGSVIVDMMRYGGAVILGLEDDVSVLDPRWLAPRTGGGWFYVSPQLDSDGDLTLAEVWTISDGSAEVSLRSFDRTRVGDVVEEGGSVPAVFSEALRLPSVGFWGTSVTWAAADWQAASAGRWQGLNKALDKHEQPALTYRIADTDADAIFSEDDEDFETPYADLDTTGRIERAAAELQKWHDSGQFRVPDAVHDMQYVTYDPHTDVSLLAIEQLRSEFESAAGVPGLLTGLQEAGMSGIALKRLLAPLYAATLSLRRQALPAIEQVAGPFEWLDSFDVLEGEPASNQSPVTDSGDEEEEEG